MTLFELKYEIESVNKLLDVKTGHSIERAQIVLTNLQKKIEEEAKRREQFETTILRKMSYEFLEEA